MLSACTVGPDYKKPAVKTPTTFKEANNTVWKKASPDDLKSRGQWWTLFHDPTLNELEKQLNCNDQNIETAKAQFENAYAMVEEARAAYFPTVSASVSSNFQAGGNNGAGGINGAAGTNGGNNNFRNYGLSASWEGDLWGNVTRNVEYATDNAESSRAALAATILSDQASLAQYYFELRGVDNDQIFLNRIVAHDQKLLIVAYAKLHEGVYSLSNVIQARNTLDTAKQTAENNKINRAIYEHAIAILIGKAPADFSIKQKFTVFKIPKVPSVLPSHLLEQRPDIAQAERNMAAMNAQIGVARAAYFPVLSLTPWAGWTSTNLSSFSSAPLFTWSIGPQLAQVLFDGGVRDANLLEAKANYRAAVSQYRQAVLTAFQNVEDSLAQLRSLNQQAVYARHADTDATVQLSLTHSEYIDGTAAKPDVDTSSVSSLNTDKNASDIDALRMTYTVALIKAIGGIW